MINKEATYFFNDESKTSEFPNNFTNLQNKIKELFLFNDYQLNDYDIIFINENGEELKIIDDNTYNIPKSTTYSIVFIIKCKMNIDDNNYNNNLQYPKVYKA